MMMNVHNQYLPVIVDPNLYYRCFLDEVTAHTMMGLTINFNLISNIINAADVFEYDSATYYPRIPLADTTPNTVVFSNLRMVVQHLANEIYDRDVRTWFYENNSLPGAR